MRKVCVYTSTRADYGLLRNLVKEISDSEKLLLSLLVSGTHLVPDQGMTMGEIRDDGFEADICIDIDLTDDSPEGICRSMGKALTEYGSFFSRCRPDILVVLGDRFETFCCAASAHVCGVPIAHIHGGETTQGAVDEAFRHCITKMAQVHFPCCESYRQRIIQMGEPSQTVYNVGALGVQNIRDLSLMSREALDTAIGMKLDTSFFLVTFHPVTLEPGNARDQFKQLLDALNHFRDHKVIFTGANADAGSGIINKMIHEYQSRHPDTCRAVSSLGASRYLSVMKLADAVIGNSSSGIMEAPVFGVPTVNIGDRQKGRVRVDSVLDCSPQKESIIHAINRALDPSFHLEIKEMDIPFERPDTAAVIRKTLEIVCLAGIMKKRFVDFVHDVECGDHSCNRSLKEEM